MVSDEHQTPPETPAETPSSRTALDATGKPVLDPDKTLTAPRKGRPPKGTSEQVTKRIVTAANQLFIKNGFSGTDMDSVASLAHCSKRTLYTRFSSKDDLFQTVMEEFLREKLDKAEYLMHSTMSLDDMLIEVATRSLHFAMTSDFVRLYRLVVCEVEKFPKLAQIMENSARRPGIQFIAGLLKSRDDINCRTDEGYSLLAEQFLCLVLEPHFRMLALGLMAPEITDRIIDEVHKAVDVFLHGCQKR